MATYTIEIQNHSVDEKDYQIFLQPGQAADNEVYAEPSAALNAVPTDGFDAYVHEGDDAAPRFYINDLAHEAGQEVDHSTVATAPVEVDFTGRDETKATVIQGPNGAYEVVYG